ncbi:MAG: carbon starvation protein A [Deltaproteobacteria bacterium]|nr:carbon starvation protein A [Deltaproteobacteria bacterium]MDQ3300927.1 carbon starvation protein A [Myxococcota bacterium]
MSLPLVAGSVLVILFLGYRFYGRFISRQFALASTSDTPAHRLEDGVDFVPTKPFYLFGQHFSAIAAAGPIVGPILACQQFGWGPALLWILFGVIFIGAVHDFTTLIASVRHDARSIAEVVKQTLGPKAWLAILAFIWLALIYVIVAFVDVTAGTFVSGDADAAGLTFRFNQGGAVALAATLYLVLALVMGVVQRFLKPPLWLATVIFVPATFAVVWLGTQYSTLLILDWRGWVLLILAYCYVASLAPMWLLLQPRGYLGGFVLYAALAVGTLGIFFGGFEIQRPAFTSFDTGGATGLLFPFLFVTIACGACSGFHGLVCSGTTSKQIDRESHCHPIGYGAMLLEAFVAVIALATIMIVAPSVKAQGPMATYANGLGAFLHGLLGIDPLVATTFGAMALSTFIFDTLDSATRLGRYILQELSGRDDKLAAHAATAATVGTPLVFLLIAEQGSYKLFWTLFGTSNQLLAALSLLAVTVWLKKLGKPMWFTLLPMLFVFAVTVVSLVIQIKFVASEAIGTAPWINGVVSAVLLGLALVLVGYAARAWRALPTPPV